MPRGAAMAPGSVPFCARSSGSRRSTRSASPRSISLATSPTVRFSTFRFASVTRSFALFSIETTGPRRRSPCLSVAPFVASSRGPARPARKSACAARKSACAEVARASASARAMGGRARRAAAGREEGSEDGGRQGERRRCRRGIQGSRSGFGSVRVMAALPCRPRSACEPLPCSFLVPDVVGASSPPCGADPTERRGATSTHVPLRHPRDGHDHGRWPLPGHRVAKRAPAGRA